jgi:hypothetical protein
VIAFAASPWSPDHGSFVQREDRGQATPAKLMICILIKAKGQNRFFAPLRMANVVSTGFSQPARFCLKQTQMKFSVAECAAGK